MPGMTSIDSLTPPAVLEEAVRRIGSQAATARLLGLSQTSVWKWVNRGKALPAEHVLAVEAATGISRHALRPDIYPIEDRAPPSPTDSRQGARDHA